MADWTFVPDKTTDAVIRCDTCGLELRFPDPPRDELGYIDRVWTDDQVEIHTELDVCNPSRAA